MIFHWRRDRELTELSKNVRKIIDGRRIDLRDNREGALSILKSDIHTLANRLNEQADALQSEKEGLRNAVANISHQLKTPLTSALMMEELLGNDGLPPEKQKEFLENLHSSLSRMEWLVLALLKMARLDSGTVTFKRERVTAGELILSALEPLRIMLELRGHNIICDMEAPLQLDCDLEWTREALTNILKNASEHSPDGGEICVSYGENVLYAWISVTDSGKGISMENLPHIFERFRTSNKRGGIGIGLSMSRAIMRGQGGDVEVASPEGRGAVFTLRFYK